MIDFRTKFLKFFALEIERDYDNRAVVGGLEKIISLWPNEASANFISQDIIDKVTFLLRNYDNLDHEQRKDCIEQLQNIFSPRKNNDANISKNQIDIPIKNDIKINHPIQANKSTHPIGLDAPLTVIHGIGVEIAKTLKKIGLNNLNDLLHYYPRRYDDFSQLQTINRLKYGDELTVIATVNSIKMRSIRGGQFKIIEAIVSDGSGSLRITWFNQPWLTKSLTPGKQIVLSGKVDMYLGRFVMTNPDWEFLDREQLHTNRIVPVYPLSSGITQKWLRRIMYEMVNFWVPRIIDFLPEWIKKNEELVDLSVALSQIHFPDNSQSLEKARKRLSFDEILILQLGVLLQKRNWESTRAEKFEIPDNILQLRINELSFQLTQAQLKALSDVRHDLVSGMQMNRLLQGDVGSGKTVIARFAIEIISRRGAQSAVMAPTSILADQHFHTLTSMLTKPNANEPALTPDEIALLIGDTSEKEKERIRQNLENGKIKVIIGTHALIEEPIIFNWLQLVVVDEQHRFGVSQRTMLRAKGKNPHLLVMSATPIPRSLALTIYGDLDLSIIDEMPIGRIPIETHVMHPVERERAYQIIKSQIIKNHQAFIIYPLIESENDEIRRAAVNEFERIKEQVFPNFNIGLLHGKLKQNEKDEIMTKFRDKEFDILVATSVIEVGLDIPNATVVLIEGANRFGLAQLHQIRGRVGRGQDPSYCLLIPDIEDNIENERLAIMAQTNDGFKLAEFDLKQRGPGEFLGTRQSGYLGLKLASLSDMELIEHARKQAIAVFQKDPDLSVEENRGLFQEVERYWPSSNGEIS